MTEQIHIMKSTLEKLQFEIDALMETIKEQNSNLKSMKWELYWKHKEKDETKLKLNNLEEKLRKIIRLVASREKILRETLH
jgi:chromosome segregation ATPase